jgi:tRNA dimethylallyltransferase
VPYHLIDIIDLTQEYNVFSFLRDSYAAFQDIAARGKVPIIVGGTGLYLNGFIRGYEFTPGPQECTPEKNPRHRTHQGAREKLDRPLIQPRILGMREDRTVLRERIAKRLRERLDAGMLDEVRSLRDAGATWERLDRLGLEYRFCAQYLQGIIPAKEILYERLYHAICQFAKRQETWFRGMERHGTIIQWT